jgi:hypothetical protein
MPTEPVFVETPLTAIPDRQVEKVIIDRFTFNVERPADSYALLDDPVVREAHDRDEYMPYWADLRVPVLLGADLTYETRNIDPLVSLIQKVLLPGGVCLLTDQDRTPAPLLREALGRAGLKYHQELMRAGEPGGYRVQGTLYRIRQG